MLDSTINKLKATRSQDRRESQKPLELEQFFPRYSSGKRQSSHRLVGRLKQRAFRTFIRTIWMPHSPCSGSLPRKEVTADTAIVSAVVNVSFTFCCWPLGLYSLWRKSRSLNYLPPVAPLHTRAHTHTQTERQTHTHTRPPHTQRQTRTDTHTHAHTHTHTPAGQCLSPHSGLGRLDVRNEFQTLRVENTARIITVRNN